MSRLPPHEIMRVSNYYPVELFYTQSGYHQEGNLISGPGLVQSGYGWQEYIRSGAIASGIRSLDDHCLKCGKSLHSSPGSILRQGVYVFNNSGGVPGSILRQGVYVFNTSGGHPIDEYWCWGCAGYRPVDAFEWQRDRFIRETFPEMATAPAYMLYDWLVEKGQYKNAEYIAAYYSGRMEEGGY